MTPRQMSGNGSGASHAGGQNWMLRWQRVARRIRVPLGFLAAALYLFDLWRRAPRPAAVALSLLLVIPGLGLRAWAAGTVKKDRELARTGPYAHTRNPLYLGSMLIAAGFALALMSWLLAVVLVVGFAVIYIPVIASEERFLRSAFPEFDSYCRSVPRLFPRFTAAPAPESGSSGRPGDQGQRFSFALYRRHREYNSALGAALLLLSLLILRPALELLQHAVQQALSGL